MSLPDSKDIYHACLIIIGNEILSGRTHDVNTPWIAEKLSAVGITIKQVRIVPDIEGEIVKAINELKGEVDYIFTTGGIGPTHDDITAQSVSKAFGVPLELNDEAYQMLVRHYGSEQEVTPARKKMAMIPKGAGLIANPVSGAPGFIMENVYVMAGVPRIMQGMLDDVKSKIRHGKRVMSNTITCSLVESQVAERLAAIQGNFADVVIGSYPHFRGGLLGLSLVLRSIDGDMLDQATCAVIDMLTELGEEPNAISIQSPGNFVTA